MKASVLKTVHFLGIILLFAIYVVEKVLLMWGFFRTERKKSQLCKRSYPDTDIQFIITYM